MLRHFYNRTDHISPSLTYLNEATGDEDEEAGHQHGAHVAEIPFGLKQNDT